MSLNQVGFETTIVDAAGIPLLSAAFIADHARRLISLVIASTFALQAAGNDWRVAQGCGPLEAHRASAHWGVRGSVMPSTTNVAQSSARAASLVPPDRYWCCASRFAVYCYELPRDLSI